MLDIVTTGRGNFAHQLLLICPRLLKWKEKNNNRVEIITKNDNKVGQFHQQILLGPN